jgi:hypothetical protein
MNVPLRKSLSVLASAAIALLMIGAAHGQAAKVIGEKPSFDDLPSPEFNGGKQKSFKPKDWLEIEAKIKVLLAPEPKSKTCDRLLVKWYLAVKNPERASTMLLLSKDIEYVSVPLDEDIYVSVYLSPASLRSLTGTDRAGKGVVEYVGYEVLVNGEKVAAETSKGQPGWWNVASNKISRTDSVPLLSKAETPFRDMWWDRYAEVSPERR